MHIAHTQTYISRRLQHTDYSNAIEAKRLVGGLRVGFEVFKAGQLFFTQLLLLLLLQQQATISNVHTQTHSCSLMHFFTTLAICVAASFYTIQLLYYLLFFEKKFYSLCLGFVSLAFA